jgi:hypothetical protein
LWVGFISGGLGWKRGRRQSPGPQPSGCGPACSPSRGSPAGMSSDVEVAAVNDNFHIGTAGMPLRRPWPESMRVWLTNGEHIPLLLQPPRFFACRLHSEGAAGPVGSPSWQRQPLKNLDFLDLSNRTCRGPPAAGSLRGRCGGATRRRAPSGGAGIQHGRQKRTIQDVSAGGVKNRSDLSLEFSSWIYHMQRLSNKH